MQIEKLLAFFDRGIQDQMVAYTAYLLIRQPHLDLPANDQTYKIFHGATKKRRNSGK